MKKNSIPLPEVNFSDEGPIRHLHLGSEWVQGSMLMDAPNVLVHEYIQRMMAWLLFVDPATVSGLQAMQLGLGAASLTKYCHKVLRMKTCAIELNPQVILACRSLFKLAADNSRLQVVLGNASVEIQNRKWFGTVDALQVDLYDHDAAAPVLDSEAFYADCRRVLTDEGCMTVNLFGRASSYALSVDKIAAAFGRDAIWAFKATRPGNTVVLGQRTPLHPKRGVLAANAKIIQTRWGLPAPQWVRVMKPAFA